MPETTLAYIRKGGSTLMLHRTKKKQDVNEGKWIGVGGKLEEGETPEACMKREIYEETGLIPTAFKYRGIVDFASGDFKERRHLYTVDAFEGSEHACDEGDLKWVRDDQILSLPGWEGDRYFLQKIYGGADCAFFHMSLVYDGDRLQSVIDIATK
ncbi:MAG: 8-oxo-dGTP diphosphatase [Clostridia bacterium]|nr:8-oxo-dGTP diphosphatase [Clostridia bacterium]